MSADNLSKSIMICAGEASGDLHGAGLVRAMHESDPNLHFFGLGGDELRLAGVEVLFDAQKIAVVGVAEVFTHLKDIISAFRILKKELVFRKPSLVILIDFADFNLRMAKTAHKQNIPIFYFITPKVWVWRKKRVKKLATLVDRAGVILPFEAPYLQERGVRAEYVGNPALDSVTIKFDRSEFCRKYSIANNKALIGILPGSRRKEVAALLPIFLESAKRMQQKYSRELVFLLPLASTLNKNDFINNGLNDYQGDLDIHVISEDRYELMASCDAVVAASGTVTMELALLDVPMVVAYRFSPITYFLGQFLVNIPFFSLVNIIADKGVVTELLQDQVNPATVEIELARLIFDENMRKNMKTELASVRKKIGSPGASKNAAKIAFQTISPRKDD